MYFLLIGLIIIVALLLCFVVMIQNSKGGGLASSFASSNQIMGVRKTTDFIEKLTWGLAGFMVVISIACAYVLPSVGTESSVIMEQAVKESATNPLNMVFILQFSSCSNHFCCGLPFHASSYNVRLHPHKR